MREWLARNGKTLGYMAGAQLMFDMSADWYANRTELSWIRHDAAKAQEIFQRHGLTGEFWKLS